jgi:hypothetical protein
VGGWGGFDDDDDSSAAERAALEVEAEGGRAQARLARSIVRGALLDASSFRVTPELVCSLHYQAMANVIPNAGVVRTRSDQEILGSQHVPPSHHDVPRLFVEACEFVNAETLGSPLFLAAYFLWRICWIHPFDDGNGRTARAASYVVLCHRMNVELPGSRPIPDRIKFAPRAYWRALEAADRAWAGGRLDVSVLQSLVAFYLEAQLRDDPVSLPPGA